METTAQKTAQKTGECHFGLHQHCPGGSTYGGTREDIQTWEMLAVYLPCQCECHRADRQQPREE